MYSTELYHHGVLGMKWGVRRYQNSDGTLTEAGKKKYRKDYDNLKYRQQNFDRQEKYHSKKHFKTGIDSVDKYIKKIHNKNSDIYKKKYNKDLKKLIDKIGYKGLSDLDKDVINEGKKRYKETMESLKKANKEAIKYIDINKDNNLFVYTPEMIKETSKNVQNSYVERKLLNRKFYK